jgi:peptidoglycan hydrolase CwlO-like protein
MSISKSEMEGHLKRLVKELKDCDGSRNKLQKQINGYEAELSELRERGSKISKERGNLLKEMDILKETLENEEAKRIRLESKMKSITNDHVQEVAEVRGELQNEVEK